MKTKNIIYIFLSVLFFISFLSCDRNVFYDKSLKVNKNGWNVSDKLYYNIEINDTNRLYDFYINIRNTTDYQYQNIFFFINTTFPNGSIAHDTLECLLADYNGYWFGKGKGNIKDNRILFKPKVIFPMSGTYKFEIEQAMRDTNIIGLSDVGIRILYTKPSN